MPKTILKTLLSIFLGLLPMLTLAQTCNPRIPSTTPTNRFTRFDNGTVLDKFTGLMWKACSEGQTWNKVAHTCELTPEVFDWFAAIQHAQATNMQGGFADYKDWRLPNIKELLTLVERQCRNPAINLEVFPNSESSKFVFLSSTRGSSYSYWRVYFQDGSDVMFARPSPTGAVYLVRDQ